MLIRESRYTYDEVCHIIEEERKNVGAAKIKFGATLEKIFDTTSFIHKILILPLAYAASVFNFFPKLGSFDTYLVAVLLLVLLYFILCGRNGSGLRRLTYNILGILRIKPSGLILIEHLDIMDDYKILRTLQDTLEIHEDGTIRVEDNAIIVQYVVNNACKIEVYGFKPGLIDNLYDKANNVLNGDYFDVMFTYILITNNILKNND